MPKIHTLLWLLSVLFVTQLHGQTSQILPENRAQQHELQSEILAESRPLLIQLPADYQTNPHKRYPVLVILDGETHFPHITGTVDWLSNQAFRIPSMIVVAIPNTNRGRDMSASYNNGGGDQFIEFIGKELLPFVDKQFRTQPFRILAGHSMAGHLTLSAFVQQPNLFNAYITMSPFFRQDRGETQLTDLIDKQLKKTSQGHHFIYASIGDEPNLMPAYQRFEKSLKQSKDGSLRWHSLVSLSDNHMSVPSNTINNALQFIFQPQCLEPTSEIARQGVKQINQYFQHISNNLYGYPVSAQSSINRLGYHLMLNEKKSAEALNVFRANVKQFPQSANAHDSLADALSRNKHYQQALNTIEQAIKLTSESSNDLRFYQRRKQRIQKAMEEQAK